MLNSISCEKLVDSPLTFKKGLNVVVGANDAHNSIGKSSILMLIDFVFGGNDFPNKCDDVIRNVGNFKIGFEFEFEKKYSFIRDTEQPDQIYYVESQEFIELKKFTEFLKTHYFSDEIEWNAKDEVLQSVSADRRHTLIAQKKDQIYEFNIFMQGEKETVFFDV